MSAAQKPEPVCPMEPEVVGTISAWAKIARIYAEAEGMDAATRAGLLKLAESMDIAWREGIPRADADDFRLRGGK
jgi:hypothetical protein